MPNSKPLPSIDRLRQVFEIDPSSPSGLRNLVTRGRLRAGLPAGSKSRFYWSVGVDGNHFYAHRLIYAIYHGVDPGENIIDHINRDTFDNRVENLRLADYRLNSVNSPAPLSNTTGVRGVSYNSRDKVYYAQIKVNKKTKHLGSFSTVEEAAKVRKAAELLFFGQNC